MAMSLLSSGILSRPTQAVFLSRLVGCTLNIGVCPPPTENDDPTNPTGPSDPVEPTEPTDPTDPTEPTDPDETPTPDEDVTIPTATVAVDPVLAGGQLQTVTISGIVADENLASYTLALDGNIVQQVTDITETELTISVPWSVATPNKVPSGIYTITLDATDRAGNTVRAEVQVEVDNDGPNATVTGGDTIIKSGSISPVVEAEDTHGVVSYAWTADTANPGAIEFDAAAEEPTFRPYFQGTYIFYVDIVDGLGNITTKTFSFGYAQQLATVPLPTTDDPNKQLADKAPSVTPASSSPAIRSNRDEVISSDDADVLGNTVAISAQDPQNTVVAAIAPTGNGWSILGILWYWWLLVVGALFAIWIGMKKLVLARVAKDS